MPGRVRWSPFLTLSAGLVACEATAQEKSATILTSSVEVTAIVPDTLENVPGSTFLIDEETLDQAQPFTAREALRLSPGVHIVDEEAFATRLNIGIRGLDPRRSARNHLLEDGMPFQLAPYSDPSNAYHPPIERVRRIEVLKGSGQIVYGPQTKARDPESRTVRQTSIPAPPRIGVRGRPRGDASKQLQRNG